MATTTAVGLDAAFHACMDSARKPRRLDNIGKRLNDISCILDNMTTEERRRIIDNHSANNLSIEELEEAKCGLVEEYRLLQQNWDKLSTVQKLWPDRNFSISELLERVDQLLKDVLATTVNVSAIKQ